jgi:DNA-binding CsgD family transcriptional regulator
VGGAEGTRPDHGPPRLLERERELALLDDAIAATRAGGAGIVVVEGPAGIGKSRLVGEARARSGARQLTVLTARGGELEREYPFGVVRQLFESRLIGGDAEALLVGAARLAAPTLGLRREGGDVVDESTFASLHGLYWLTVNLSAQGPLLLAIDDLHWCDHPSLRFLGYLARRLEGLPVLVVASVRPTEAGVDESLLNELMGDPLARRLVLRPLSEEAATDVIRGRLGDGVDPAFSRACHESTHGNPLFLAELLNAVEAEQLPPDADQVAAVRELGPRAVARAVQLRLARLTPQALSVASWVAVLGDGAESEQIGALAGLDREEIAAAGRELVRTEIVRPESPFAFVHPLIRAAVYHDLAPGERELRHLRAAQLLLRLDAPSEQVAAHLLNVPRLGEPWIVDVLRSAATSAFAKGAPDAAITSLRRALAEPLEHDTRTELLFELAKAQSLMYLPDAVPAFREVLEAAVDAATRVDATDWLLCSLTFLGSAEEATDMVRRTAIDLPPDLADLGRQLEAGELISLFFGGGRDVSDRLERLRGYRTIDPAQGLGARMLASVAAWEWAEGAGPASDVVALARAALADRSLISADAAERAAGALLAIALADLDEAADWWDDVRAEAHRTGFVFTMLAYQLWGGYTQYLRGELADAELQLRAGLATAARWGVPAQQPWATSVLAEILVDRGLTGEARAMLAGAVLPVEESDPAVLLDRAWMRLLLAEGRAADALALADAFEEHAAWRRHPRYVPWRSLKALALDRVGRTEEAIVLANDELAIAREWGTPGTVGRSLRVLGTIERVHGLAHLEEACALLEAAPARLEQAKALTALGEALRRANRPTEAREPLRRALELAETSGADALVERARAAIYATGARPRTSALRGPAALTSSERRVAGLAAEGLSNRDIAQTLYVTPKTVEVHLSSVYRKLDIASRRELARALAPTG